MSDIMRNKAILFELNKRGIEVVDLVSFSIFNFASTVYCFKIKKYDSILYFQTLSSEIDDFFFQKIDLELDLFDFKFNFAKTNKKFFAEVVDLQMTNKYIFYKNILPKPTMVKGSSVFCKNIIDKYKNVEDFIFDIENISLSGYEEE